MVPQGEKNLFASQVPRGPGEEAQDRLSGLTTTTPCWEQVQKWGDWPPQAPRTTALKKKVSVGEAVERMEPSHTVGRNMKWCSHCGKEHGIPQEVKKYCVITIPLLSMKPKDFKAGSQRDI